MEECSPSLDRISNLPSHISQIILISLPLRDMARTSILSKNWRYQWVKVPQLVFKDDPMYLLSREEKYRYNSTKVFKILLLHHGPILKFTLDMTAWPNCSELYNIIPFLSRNGIKELTLLMPKKDENFKLSPSILSCVGLRHLRHSRCVFQPLTLVGFSKLVSLELSNVGLDSDVSISSCPFLESLVLCLKIRNFVNLFSIDAPNLNKLYFNGEITRIGIMNTPLLKVLRLITQGECYTGNSSVDLISFLHALPLLEDLIVCYSFLRVLALGDSLNQLPKFLNNLRMLELFDVEFSDVGELSPSLWFLRSSPNLQKLKITVAVPKLSLIAAEVYLKMQEHSNYSLLKLQVVDMLIPRSSRDPRLVIEFSKFLLDISPVLRTLYIKPDFKFIDGNGYKKLLELACYPRAAPKARIVYAGLESLNLTLA